MSIFKNGVKMSGSLIVAAIISFFLCVSMLNICSAIFTKEIGYDAYVYENETSEDIIAQYSYTYTDEDGDGKDDGQDIKKIEYEKLGYSVITVKTRSSLEGSSKAIFLISTQALCLIMVTAFSSSSVYKQGFKDRNLARIGHIKEDMLKGFKIGLVGNIPFLLLFVLLLVLRVIIGVSPNEEVVGGLSQIRVVWYAFLNSQYYPLITLISAGVQEISQLNIIQLILFFLLQLIAPAISGVSYILGYKEINLAEKLVYKKEEE